MCTCQDAIVFLAFTLAVSDAAGAQVFHGNGVVQILFQLLPGCLNVRNELLCGITQGIKKIIKFAHFYILSIQLQYS